jgi:hypothetical protein
MLVANVARSASAWRDEALLHRRGIARTFHQEHMEVRGHRLGTKLPHHQSDLASVVRGMVRHMLHQVRQSDLRGAKWEHSFQQFICQAVHELGLFFLDFGPL